MQTENDSDPMQSFTRPGKKLSDLTRLDHFDVVRRISKWYDSEAVRFFFFREKFPRHGVAETLPMPMLMFLGLTSALLATIDFYLLYYGFIASLLFFAAVAWGFLEALHYLYDRT